MVGEVLTRASDGVRERGRCDDAGPVRSGEGDGAPTATKFPAIGAEARWVPAAERDGFTAPRPNRRRSTDLPAASSSISNQTGRYPKTS
ncbi:hypothetical protein PybrP1_002654 [[Pythium] brassicae (nom. inval.)]|nr:hypothetical protein PybrP1_002654 [[Pythium] brassicae (nom. inval.)]